MFVYADDAAGKRLAPFATTFVEIPDDFELVHERMLKIYRDALQPMGLRRWLRSLPAVLAHAMGRNSTRG
jgi:hypothetical protein